MSWPAPQAALVLVVFGAVYLGMILGGLPRLRLDRSGVALLGAIAMIGFGGMTPAAAAAAIDVPTMLLLFSFMVISAQMRLGGFYGAVTRRIAGAAVGPRALLAIVIAVVALLAAVFSNDIVCLAVAPVLAQACLRRGLDPVPFLLALAAAANIGSAATLIGNPQNMLIGQVLGLSFGRYLLEALPPVAASLVVLWAVLARACGSAPTAVLEAGVGAADEAVELDRWQTAKGLAAALVLIGVFVATDWPREVVALVAAGFLLTSARLHSASVMSLVDWPLLVLFAGLFVVNDALARTGVAEQTLQALAAHGWPLSQTAVLFGATLVLSNLVSNVPAVMLLLPVAQASGPEHGATLALVSTLAGNLWLVGSIANLIVVDAARRHGIVIGWRRHLQVGLPVTFASLALTALWLGAR